MKTIFKTILALAALFAAASCAKEIIETEPCGPGLSSISVSLPELEKTSIGAKTGSEYKLTWSEGDVIYANGVASKPLTASRAGSSTATFSFPNPVSAPYNITYAGNEGTDDMVTIPSTQVTTVPQYYKTSYNITFKDGVEPMYAYSDDGNDVSFHHLGAVLRIPLKGDSDSRQIRHISVSADADEPVCGSFRIAKTAGKLNGTLSPVSGTTTANLTCATGYTTLSTAGSRVYVIVVAPGKYEKGITASVVASDGAVMYLHAFTNQTLVAGKVYEYPETTFAKDDKYDVTIQNESQLASFYQKLSEGQKVLNAVIVKDIEVKTPATTWPAAINEFVGTIDGGGHTIKGLTCPMFNELDGKVSNLTLNSTINETLPVSDTNWTGILARRIYRGGYVKNCTTKGSLSVTVPDSLTAAIGGVVGYMVRAYTRSCTNEATITVNAQPAKACYVGGVVGRIYASGDTVDVSGSMNKGAIVVAGTALKAYVGGVVGTNELTLEQNKIDGCVNYGNVSVNLTTVKSTDEAYFGGVAGNSNVDITNVCNYGNVTVDGTYEGLVDAGGVVGKLYQASMTDVHNYGTLALPSTCALKVTSNVGGVAGYASNQTYTLSNIFNHGTVRYDCQCLKEQMLGGVIGESYNALNNVCNDGAVVSTGAKAQYLRVGGVIGHTASSTPSATKVSSTERARVRVENFTSTSEVGISIAGLIGYSSSGITMSDFSNAGSVELVKFTPTASPTRLCMGGVIGFHSSSNNLILNNVNNTGHILVDGALTKTSTASIGNVSGMLGMVNQYGITTNVAVTMTGCSNSGHIELNCGTSKSKFILASGLVSAINAKTFTMTDCTNSGNIDFTGLIDTMYVGGLVARLGAAQNQKHVRSVTITGATNNGNIMVTETTAANRVAAGGIVGVTASPLNFPISLQMSGCTNNGNIDRRATTIATKYSFAGGIFGALGYSNASGRTGTGVLMGIGCTVQNCTNNGMIRFNQVASDSASDLGEKSDAYTFTGGICGIANAVNETGGATIKSCINKGNIWSTCGRHGGISGLVKGSVLITGTKDAYTKNEGLIVTRSAGAWNSGTSTAVLYSGGIVGQVQNDLARGQAGDSAVIEYCWNSGTVGGGVATGGILGAVNSGDSKYTIVRYCKTNGLVQMFKNKGTQGARAICGRQTQAIGSINNCAIGGKYLSNPASGTGTPVAATADNYYTYIACGASNADYYASASAAQADNNYFWDGTSKTAWE